MPVTARHVSENLDAYLGRYPSERSSLEPAFDLLSAGADLVSRAEFRGHATAGAILARPDGQLLLIHHRATGKWLFPGGHLELADPSLLHAAIRELTEETGIPARLVTPANDEPLHIDIHPIAERPAKSEPAHQHIDFRYLFTTTADTGQLQAEEVSGAAWHPAHSFPNQDLRSRILAALA